MYLYKTGPIDFWDGCTLLHLYINQTYSYSAEDIKNLDWKHKQLAVSHIQLLSFFEEALKIAKEKANFEGHIAYGPYISAIPNPLLGNCEVIILWKQRDNGITFIASKTSLDWLSDHLIYKD